MTKTGNLLLLSLHLCCIDGIAQPDDIRRLDRKLDTLRERITLVSGPGSTLKFPKRKYDSPLFCNELIPCKGGYIINSLSIAPGSAPLDHHYRYFFLNPATNKLETLITSLTDSIESVIAWNNALYLSGKKNNDCVIGKVDTNGTQVITRSIRNSNGQKIGMDSWVKLGIYKDQLLAFDKNGLFVFQNGQWESIFGRPFPARVYEDRFRMKYPLIPTENIRIAGNTLHFLQEITQERTAYLYSLNLEKDSCATEFFNRNALTDNTKKEIVSYSAGASGLWISVLRLMKEALVLRQSNGAVTALVINSQGTTQQGLKTVLQTSCISAIAGDTLAMAGSDGLFLLVNSHLTPLAFFTNTSQEIKVEGGRYQFEFIPRCLVRLSGNRYLIGGLWGGLYLVDIDKRSVQCLDDLKDTPARCDLQTIFK